MRIVYSRTRRIGRKIINYDTESYGVCAWDECDLDACSLFRIRTHEHHPAIGCEAVDSGLSGGGRHVWYAFCTERHKQYWLNASGPRAGDSAGRHSGRIYGMLPPGFRQSLL